MEMKDIARILKDQDSFILTSHEAADADAVGSVLALYDALTWMGKKVFPLLSDPISEKYLFMDPQRVITAGDLDEALVNKPLSLPDRSGTLLAQESILIVLDTVPHNTGKIGETLLPVVQSIVVIDHHDGLPEGSCQAWLEPGASSTCEMVYELLELLDYPLTEKTAIALYAGIIYDTGSFIYPKTGAKTFRIAEDLVLRGVIPNTVYSSLYENKSVSALLLQTRVLQSLELIHNNHIAFMHMPRQFLTETGASYDEAQEIINIPLQSRDVRVSIFFKEDEKGFMRCSLRSKGEVNCAALAQEYNGGGHRTAAGFKIQGSFERIKADLLDKLIAFFS